MSTTPKTDKLKIRERRLVKGLAAGLTPTEAMRQAGYAETTAKCKAVPKVRESRIQESIQELMEARGLTKDKLLSKLDEGLGSTKLIGEAMIEVTDFSTRHKYLDTALKLGNHYPSEKIEHSGAIEIKSIEVKIVD